MNPVKLSPQAEIMKFIVGKWISKPIYVVAELGIADILSDGPKRINEIANLSQPHAPSLYRVMRVLASVGIFEEVEDRQFKLTPMAECLKSGAMRSIALMFGSDWNEKAWMHLLESVKNGDTPFEKAHGMSISEWLEKHPSDAQVLHEANSIKALNTHRVIVEEYDFSNFKSVTDVGGGTGALISEILKAYPSLTGFIAELPNLVSLAEKTVRSRGFEDRCTIIECDFFNEIPKDSDCYILSNILHDWPDEACKKILQNCQNAMMPGSKLLTIEMIVPPLNEPSVAKLLDLEMFVITGGRERTEPEFRELLKSAGLKTSRVIPTREEISIIEAIRG